MKTELNEISPTQREIKIEIEAEVVRETYNKVSQKYARGAQVPGFRKGFAPVDVVRMRFREEISNEVLRELVPEKVSEAIREHDLAPLGEPHLHLEDAENIKVNGTQPINLHVHVEVMPEIPAPDYKNLEAVRRVRPVSDEELERVINERRRMNSTLVPVENRKSKEKDTLIVDLEGVFLDKPDEEPIKANDLEITLGDERIEKSFTENLAGLGADEEKEFTVEYAEDFSSPALAGQKVKYKAKVKSLGTMEMPEADDEWASSLEEGFASIADLRRRLRGDLETAAKAEADNRVRDELITKLIENHEFEVPNALIERQARGLLDNFARDLANQGVNLEGLEQNFVQMAYENMKTQAERDVRGAMLLEKIAELETVQVTGDEIATEIERVAGYYGVTAEEVRASLTKQGGENSIVDTLRSRKAVEALVAQAKVSEGEWIDETQAKTDGSAEEPSEAEEKKTKTRNEKKTNPDKKDSSAENKEPATKKSRKKS